MDSEWENLRENAYNIQNINENHKECCDIKLKAFLTSNSLSFMQSIKHLW